MTHPARRIHCPLLFALLALVLLGCGRDPGESSPKAVGPDSELARKTQELTPAQIRTINFELLSDWQVWSGSGAIASSTNHV